jgi:RNA polymerase sigma-70 factor, ECF subfamily
LGSQDPTSRSLLLRVKANDQEAWQRLIGLYSPLVSHWCRQWGAAADDLPDLVQEVFASVANGLETYRGPGPAASFRGWLRTIARNTVCDHLRRGPDLGQGGSEALIRLRELPADADDPSGSSDGDAEVAGLYHRALDQVQGQFEERTWQAFWEVAIEDRSPSDVASELGLSPNGVRQAKSRVLRRLREELGDLIA